MTENFESPKLNTEDKDSLKFNGQGSFFERLSKNQKKLEEDIQLSISKQFQEELKSDINNKTNEKVWNKNYPQEDISKHKEKKSFKWIILSLKERYTNIPRIWKVKIDKNRNFYNCPLTRKLWRVFYKNADTSKWAFTHFETFYSEKKLPWTWLKIPWRHVADDWTIRDIDGYICLAANLKTYPKWTIVMTTLWPWKVYDTWQLESNHIDIYTNR